MLNKVEEESYNEGINFFWNIRIKIVQNREKVDREIKRSAFKRVQRSAHVEPIPAYNIEN